MVSAAIQSFDLYAAQHTHTPRSIADPKSQEMNVRESYGGKRIWAKWSAPGSIANPTPILHVRTAEQCNSDGVLAGCRSPPLIADICIMHIIRGYAIDDSTKKEKRAHTTTHPSTPKPFSTRPKPTYTKTKNENELYYGAVSCAKAEAVDREGDRGRERETQYNIVLML